jgi:ubiquinone biosynthesis protein COQ9
MSDSEFDSALVAAAFAIAGDRGWQRVSVVEAARAAGLSLPEARTRFPTRAMILLRFGQLADRTALTGAPDEGPVRDRLFDILMRRYDALQPHRAGIKALMQTLPFNPARAALLHCATQRSMRWMLQAAGVSTAGPRGTVQVKALTAIWYWGLRTWERDDTEDLSATMATLDAALGRADRCAAWLTGRRTSAAESGDEQAPTDDAGELPDDSQIIEP